MNFLHMTGGKTRLSAQQFYAACLESKLSERDFEIDHRGKVQQEIPSFRKKLVSLLGMRVNITTKISSPTGANIVRWGCVC